MSQLSKNQLKAENQSQFPNNNVGAITPSHLRAFNVDMIDSTVNQTDFTSFSGSVASEIDTLQAEVSALENVSASLIGSASNALTTASFDNGTRDLTFTKGDSSTFALNIPASTVDTGSFVTTSSFEAFTASADSRLDNIEAATSSFITSAQTASMTVLSASFAVTAAFALNTVQIDTGSLVTTASFNAYTQSNDARVGSLEAATASYVTETESGSFLITASFASQTLTFTKGDNTTFSFIIPDVSGSTIDTASFATTGSNTFRGNETFEDTAGNWSTLVPTSGSLMLVARGYNSASAHITTYETLASANQYTNIIFKNNNNAVSTYVEGSNNIFVNPSTAVTQTRRYIGGSGNIITNQSAAPTLSGSSAFVILNDNIINNFQGLSNGSILMRYVPDLTTTYWTISSNIIPGQIQIGADATTYSAKGLIRTGTVTRNIALGTDYIQTGNSIGINGSWDWQRNISQGSLDALFSSTAGLSVQSNLVNGYTVVESAYSTGSTSNTGIKTNIQRNLFLGGGSQFAATVQNYITITGAYSVAPLDVNISDNLIGGINSTVSINAGADKKYMRGVSVFGQSLFVSGSSTSTNSTWGSAFFGRFNANDGVRNTTDNTVFAVGTGTATGARKTGFLIDSGSNTFVEGTFNVSGSTSLNGNLIVTGSLTASLADGYMYVGNGSGITTAIPTSSLSVETASLATNALDIVVNVKNTTGVQIDKGTVVRIIGAVGDNPLIGTASWEDDNNSANTLGFVVADIANDAFGRVMTQGTLLAVDTDPALGYAAGDLVYLSSSGQYTNVKPPAPYHEVRLGQVLRAQQNNGSIYVLIQNGYELEELHNVDINTGSLANKDILAYDSASTQWENWSISELGLATTGSNGFVGTETISGSLIVTGSARGNVQALTISSNTASMDMSSANYFTLTLADTATTHITATNIQPGLSATLVITTGTNSSASLAPTLLEPSGSDYVASNGSAKKDVLSFVAVDTTNMFVVSTKNMI